MAVIEASPEPVDDGPRTLSGVLRFYDLAKRHEWQVSDLPWNERPPIPEYSGPDTRVKLRKDIWRSVIGQQLQADLGAVNMSAQLLTAAAHPEAKLYYSTLFQDEVRHTQSWLGLTRQVGEPTDHDPHLDKLIRMTLDADTMEEKVFQMQVFFERLIIPRFRMIARASRGTVLADLCERAAIDDGIHHGSGVAYAEVLMAGASQKTKAKLVNAANNLLPVFAAHALWRPKARERIGRTMEAKDKAMIREDIIKGIGKAGALGVPIEEIDLTKIIDGFSATR